MILTHATPGVKSGAAQSQLEPNPHEIKRAVLASDLTSGQKAVLLAILDHAGYGRSSCFARNDTLSEETHLGIQHVSNTVQKLARDGWIIIHRSTRFGPRTLFVGPRLTAECALHVAEVEAKKRAKRNPLQTNTLYERCYNPSYSAAMSPVIAPLELETKPLTCPLTDPLTSSLRDAEESDDDGIASWVDAKTQKLEAVPAPEVAVPGPQEIPTAHVEAFTQAFGEIPAAELVRCQAQFLRAAKDMDTLKGAILATVEVGKKAKNPLGVLTAKCKDFTGDRVPAAYQGEPKPKATPTQPTYHVRAVPTQEASLSREVTAMLIRKALADVQNAPGRPLRDARAELPWASSIAPTARH